MTRRLYMDHNATVPLHGKAKQAMIEAMEICGNASSVHEDGRRTRRYIEEVRQTIAAYFHAKPAQVVLTSGATEANNLIMKGFKGNVIASAIEHDSILQTRADIKICRVNALGILDLNHLEDLLQKIDGSVLVSIMAANNETGVVQPLDEVVKMARRYGALVHSDVVQAVGKWPMDWAHLGLNYLSLSAHKIGGPQGVGALIIDEKYPLRPLITGGGQERYFRSGTENFFGIVGFGAALRACEAQNWSAIATLRDNLEDQLMRDYPPVEIFGKVGHGALPVPRLPNTTNIQMPGVKNNIQVMFFDLQGISLSAGSACSSGKVKTSHVLKAMNIEEPALHESVRLSFGLNTTTEDIQLFIKAWEELYQRSGTLVKN